MRSAVALAMIVAASGASPAAAQGRPGAVRLGLHGAFYTNEAFTTSADDPDGSGTTEVEETFSTIGIGTTALGADLGFGIGDYVVLGGRVTWSGSSYSFEGDEVRTEGFFMILPDVEAVLLPGQRIRPAFAATVGFVGRSTSTHVGDTDNESSYGGF